MCIPILPSHISLPNIALYLQTIQFYPGVIVVIQGGLEVYPGFENCRLAGKLQKKSLYQDLSYDKSLSGQPGAWIVIFLYACNHKTLKKTILKIKKIL